MKRIALSLLLAAGFLSGCHKSGIKSGEAGISGTFSPPVTGYLTYTAGPVLDSARIGKDGEFKIILPLDEPVKAMLYFGNRITDVYLEPGKEVTLAINSVTFPERTSFGGELGPVNHYLTLARKLDQQTFMPATELFSKEPAQFIRFSDSTKQMKVKLLDEYRTKYKEIDPDFVAQTRSEIEFSWANNHLQYPGEYQLIKGVPPAIQDGYHFDYLNQLNLNSVSNLTSPSYKVFIQNYLDYRQSVYLAENPNTASLIFPESVARFRVIHKDVTDPDILDYLLYTAMDNHLANYGTIRIETFLTDFRVTCRNQEYVKEIETIVTNLDKVGSGKPALNFTAYTPEGKKVNITDYFGQLLYIGFWASWSEWSLQEIPYFEQLRKDFEGKPVKFIMVSLDFDKDKNLWAAIVKRNNFGSIQLFQDSKSSILKDNYYLNDFPRYFLIDKDGLIISVYAPRPTENIAETLNRVLSKTL